MVLISAKSTLIKPGVVINSAIPFTPWCKTASIFLNASKIGVFLSIIFKILWLGTTIKVSTFSFSFIIPSSAQNFLLLPSNSNGLVTTAIVKAPLSLAISAITGDAPVPVPPPSPQAKKIMSAPDKSSFNLSRDSSAAWRPTSGSPPEPKPLVKFSPIWIFIVALLLRSAWTSVLTAINSTPLIPPSATIKDRAFPPPPPTPTTFILAACPARGLINIVKIQKLKVKI